VVYAQNRFGQKHYFELDVEHCRKVRGCFFTPSFFQGKRQRVTRKIARRKKVGSRSA